MTRVLVTGAAGFIGGRILAQLRDAGFDVIGIDSMLAAAHGEHAQHPPGVHQADVADSDTMSAMLDGVDVVCHQAAMVGAGVDASDAPRFARENDLATAELLASMYRAGCDRLVLASSMVVYGMGSHRTADGHRPDVVPQRRREDLAAGLFDHRLPSGERLHWALTGEEAPIAPQSSYAASKAAQEYYARAWALATGGSVTALRYHNVYGPGMPRDTPYAGVASIFRSQLASGRAPKVFEDGRQMRDFVHVDDVARANLAAIEDRSLESFRAFNICSGRPIAIGEVATILAEAAGGPPPIVTGEHRVSDVRHVVADPAAAEAELGFRASTMPEVGIARFAGEPLRESVERAYR
ncbi:NAD-dependent epimerase/dehydratase family protein [Gordonia soli]|uniref:Putative nucleotide-sugar epimerase n=1 Tax=Gordonia soli NBRC 108243 TaxID=1223545 RepID=M0QDC2_9ACTN|nr:NAD-dependent epimerase/dehydratase family protein [Gordonia soli]GAC66575.1 putative nucleotide-sugar epimerase [Gordonia soli NBRC 108243]